MNIITATWIVGTEEEAEARRTLKEIADTARLVDGHGWSAFWPKLLAEYETIAAAIDTPDHELPALHDYLDHAAD